VKDVPSLSSGRHLCVATLVLLMAVVSAAAETIQLQWRDGAYVVPVRVNGSLVLPFVIDSGASDVSIPADVVSTLTRTGTVTSADFIGSQNYVLADGSVLPSYRFLLRELTIGNHVVRGVVANVAPVKGDPLLGQSFLSKLPAWTIDNNRRALVLNDVPSALPLPPQPPPSGGSVNDQFNRAFGLVKQADYDGAEVALKGFIQAHPNDPLAGNAQYWLGQTYFVRNNFTEAANAFAEGYKRYPNSSKAAPDLLYLGMSLGRADQKQNACVALAQLDQTFPNPDPAISQRAAAEKKRDGC
jgi:tol-pal system protein YbgF